MAGKYFMSRRWRSIKLVWALFATELAFTIPALALFAIAQPNLYRTALWQDGYDNGFNSNPIDPIYAMTNREPYTYPIVWSQFITDFNVVISVLSLFFMLAKGAMFIVHLFIPILGFLVHGGLMSLWAYSIWAQTQPDHSEPAHSQLNAPWYIAKSCSVAHNKNNVHYCMQAKAALAVTVVMCFLFACNTVLAIWSMYPTRAQRVARMTSVSELDEDGYGGKGGLRFGLPPMTPKQRDWEMQALPSKTAASASTPYTPRTTAFNTLGGRDLPLRER